MKLVDVFVTFVETIQINYYYQSNVTSSNTKLFLVSLGIKGEKKVINYEQVGNC